MQSRDNWPRHCALAHDLNNKLAAIVGYCDLMAESTTDADTGCLKRLAKIRELALSMAEKVNGHDCRMMSCNAEDIRCVSRI
jgi:hypothetical protein